MKKMGILLLLCSVALTGFFTTIFIKKNVVNVVSTEGGVTVYGSESEFYNGAGLNSMIVLNDKEQPVLTIEAVDTTNLFYYLSIKEGVNNISSKDISDTLVEFTINGKSSAEVTFHKNTQYKIIANAKGKQEIHFFELQ